MILISANLMFAYAYYDSVDDLILTEKLCKDIEYYDYSVFFDYYGSSECIDKNINQKVLLYHRSSIFPNVQRMVIFNKTVTLYN